MSNEQGPIEGCNVGTGTNPDASGPVVPDHTYYWEREPGPESAKDIGDFYHSGPILELRERICEMGRRLWQREFTDGNGGNITVRVGENLVLCTPTLISKGFMKPEDICLIDMDGRQMAGGRKRTSEAMTHLAIMKRQPGARACCHAHPPHATAFAIAGLRPPSFLIPEAEIFLGEIGMAAYQTPGSPKNAETVGREAVDHQCVLMLNHGVITWSRDVEDAYWKMENVDSYCRTVWIASSLGKPLAPITGAQAKALIDLRLSLGMDDRRAGMKAEELCDGSVFGTGPDTDALADAVAARVLKALGR